MCVIYMLSIHTCFPYRNSPENCFIIPHNSDFRFFSWKKFRNFHLCRFCIPTSLYLKFMWQIVWKYNPSLSYLHLCCSPYPSLAPCTNFEIFCFSIFCCCSLLLWLLAAAPPTAGLSLLLQKSIPHMCTSIISEFHTVWKGALVTQTPCANFEIFSL